MKDAYNYILLIVITGGFGGFVHGLLRHKPTHYVIQCPLCKSIKELGFVGDILIGIAAGTSVFFVMESLFGLKLTAETGGINPQDYLRMVALGVICGYMGSSLLDGLALVISKRLIKAQEKLEEEQRELEKLKARVKASSQATQLIQLADAHLRWGNYDEALELYDEAIAVEPSNANHYIHKSFVYTSKAEKKGDTSLYEVAIDLVNHALEVDGSSVRAYYNRACYKQLLKRPKDEVLADLKTAIELDDTMRRMAKHDPDFLGLQADPDFKSLIEKVKKA